MKKSAFSVMCACAFIGLAVAKPLLSAQDSYSSTSAASASLRPINAPLKDLCNQVMLSIYNDIAALKGKYTELEKFGPQVLSQNQYGIYAVEYEYLVQEGFRKGERAAFGLTLVRLEDTNFHQYGDQSFNFGFPLLDLKFAGYQEMFQHQEAFDIQTVIQKNGDPLLKKQNDLLPLKLTLETVKESYLVGEDIEITVALENVSARNLWVKELSQDTLFFLYGDTPWGARTIGENKRGKIKRQILEPGQNITARFVGSGFLEPQDVEIFGSYAVTFQGVNPSSFLTITIKKE